MWWTLGKVGSVGNVNFDTNDHAWTFVTREGSSPLSRSSCGTPEIVGRTKFCFQKGISGDQGTAHPCCAEREQEKQAAPRFAYLHLLSWTLAQVPAGPPLTKGGAVSKQAKEFAQFLRDLGRDYHWSILCLQEFTASTLFASIGQAW